MQGSCLCGAVRYHILSAPRSVVGCHCSQCRKSSGHYVAATQVQDKDLKIEGQSHISWYQSSEFASRGFCKTCGSQLFWKVAGTSEISIMAGTIDGNTNLEMDRQIHSESKGDYYVLPDVKSIEQSSL